MAVVMLDRQQVCEDMEAENQQAIQPSKREEILLKKVFSEREYEQSDHPVDGTEDAQLEIPPRETNTATESKTERVNPRPSAFLEHVGDEKTSPIHSNSDTNPECTDPKFSDRLGPCERNGNRQDDLSRDCEESAQKTSCPDSIELQSQVLEQMKQTENEATSEHKRQSLGEAEKCHHVEEILKENQETRPIHVNETYREQTKRSHRKSASPNHVGDHRRLCNVLNRKSPESMFLKDRETSRREHINRGSGEVVIEDDDLLKFAEILYKCSLCTTLPCILTSQSAFLSHLKEHHLPTQAAENQCPSCHLHFQTNTDLQAHLSSSHHCVDQENYRNDEADSASTHHHDMDQESGDLPVSENEQKLDEKEDRFFRRGGGSPQRSLKKTSTDQDSDGQGSEDADRPQSAPKTPTSQTYHRTSSTPMATVEYHSSQHLHRLQLLTTSPTMSPPLHQQQQQQQQQPDLSRSPLFSSPVEGINGFPSFTPEFGRFTKLVREGGRIVYFCQVCNIKCQVKAAFQVHCNGLRHHNAVNVAGKNKAGVVSPLTSRDSSLRTPLKEMPVVGPRLSSPRGDNSFVEKMTKFFHDHPDVSAVLNHPKDVSDFFPSPVNCSLKDRSAENGGFRSSRTNSRSPDKNYTQPTKFRTENFCRVSNLQQERFPKNYGSTSSRLNSDDLDESDACIDSKDEVYDLVHGSRKRAHVSSVTNSEFSSTSENESLDLSMPSSIKCYSAASCKVRKDNGSDARVVNRDSPAPKESKRPRIDSSHAHERQTTPNEAPRSNFQEDSLKRNHKCDSDTNQSRTLLQKPDQSRDCIQSPKKENCDVDETVASVLPSDDERDSTSERDMTSEHEMMPERDCTSAENRSDVHTSSGKLSSETKFSFSEGSCSIDRLEQTAVGMMLKSRYPAETSSYLFSSVVSDGWLGDARAKDRDQSLWSGVGLAVQDCADDVTTDASKGQNNEGWKVTQIRDVLRGLISASSKGSSVSRDVLLHRVSLVLRAPDVQHWGPACNRAVRDLFPHCLAQRKGKFKKTYFFGLSLRPGLEESKGGEHVDGTSFRPLRDMTQDLEQLLEHLPGLLYWSGHVERGVSRDDVLQALAARLSESEVFHWGMQCNKALRMLFPLVLMKRKGKYKTVYFGVDFTLAAKRLLPTLGTTRGQALWHEQNGSITY